MPNDGNSSHGPLVQESLIGHGEVWHFKATHLLIRGPCNKHICKNWCSLVFKKKIRKTNVILLSICFVVDEHDGQNPIKSYLTWYQFSNLTHYSKSKIPVHNKICQSNLTN